MRIAAHAIDLALAALSTIAGWPGVSAAQEAPTQPAILINDARIFDGIGHQLRRGNLLIVGSKIKQISADPIAPPLEANVIASRARRRALRRG